MTMDSLYPTALHQLDTATLGITWNDGHQSAYPVRNLRLACRCALCVDELTGAPRLDPDTISPTVKPVATKPVGSYAIHISWSDGHATGFYRYDYLRKLCSCPACRPPVKSGCGSGCGCSK